MQARDVSESDLRSAISQRIGETKFGVWFGDGVRLGVDGDRLVVGVPNGFFREWIRTHYTHDLIQATSAVVGRPLELDVRIDAEAEPPLGHVVEDPPSTERQRKGPVVPIPTGASQVPSPVERPRDRHRLSSWSKGVRAVRSSESPGTGKSANQVGSFRPSKRLEDFVVGPGNRLAHAAAVEMAHSGGGAFNPLVIHGGVGLGKTHLLEGIATALKTRNSSAVVVGTTAESFTNSFLEAIRGGGLQAFRNRFRRADALLIDDVHFLAAKRATQDEFLHTFNALAAIGAPIVLATDQHPRLIDKLPEELVTRFLGGMVVRIDAPDMATRQAILAAKATARGVSVPSPVLSYIAEHMRASVRELEGALNNLVAQAMLTGKRIDLNLAKSALRDTIRHTAQTVMLEDIEKVVCATFQLPSGVLRTDSRTRTVAQPRMLAMYLARKHTEASYNEIGRFFGGRNHSTVIAAEKKVVGWLREEERIGLLAGFESVADVLASLESSLGT